MSEEKLNITSTPTSNSIENFIELLYKNVYTRVIIFEKTKEKFDIKDKNAFKILKNALHKKGWSYMSFESI